MSKQIRRALPRVGALLCFSLITLTNCATSVPPDPNFVAKAPMVLTTKDITAGSVIRPGDLEERLEGDSTFEYRKNRVPHDYLHSAQLASGRIAKNKLNAGDTVCNSDLGQYSLARAKSNISEGTVIGGDDVTTWLGDEAKVPSDALFTATDASGRTANKRIQSGAIVQEQDLQPSEVYAIANIAAGSTINAKVVGIRQLQPANRNHALLTLYDAIGRTAKNNISKNQTLLDNDVE